jgi:hypothetical protein
LIREEVENQANQKDRFDNEHENNNLHFIVELKLVALVRQYLSQKLSIGSERTSCQNKSQVFSSFPNLQNLSSCRNSVGLVELRDIGYSLHRWIDLSFHDGRGFACQSTLIHNNVVGAKNHHITVVYASLENDNITWNDVNHVDLLLFSITKNTVQINIANMRFSETSTTTKRTLSTYITSPSTTEIP